MIAERKSKNCKPKCGALSFHELKKETREEISRAGEKRQHEPTLIRESSRRGSDDGSSGAWETRERQSQKRDLPERLTAVELNSEDSVF